MSLHGQIVVTIEVGWDKYDDLNDVGDVMNSLMDDEDHEFVKQLLDEQVATVEFRQ